MPLSPAHRRLLRALAAGHTLKAHRDLEGGKVFRLHFADSRPAEDLDRRLAEDLVARGLLDSNKKFPAATFWLTAAGRELARTLAP
jgi:hypothetical protein